MTTTPGPWVAKSRATGGYNIVAVDDVLEDVVIGTAVLNDHSLETAYANAQMLAASQALYEACASVWAALADTDDMRLRDLANECRAAIGAATGEQS